MVVAELGAAVAAAAAAEAAEVAGTATKKMDEEEIQRQRRIYTYDGGLCFKAIQLALNTFRSRQKMARNLFFDG